MTVRSADLLVVSSGEVPLMRRAGEAHRLSMPALNHELVLTFVTELVDDEGQVELEDAGALETLYQAEGGGEFAVKLESKKRGVRLTFRPHGQKTTPEAAPSPVPGVAAPSPLAAGMAPDSAPGSTAPDPGSNGSLSPFSGFSTAPVHPGVDAIPSPGALLPPGAGSDPVGEPVAAAAVPAMLAPLLERADYENASDVILSSGQSPRMRRSGELTAVSGAPVTERDLWDLVLSVAGDRGAQILARTGSIDLALQLRPGLRFRVNVFRQSHGLAAAIRPIRRDLPTLHELNLPDHLHDLVAYPHGLVLVCGPTGSGKSTTLVALIEHLNKTRSRHIVTIEDPIEYQYQSRQSLIHQREIGAHVDGFASGLRAALREDPDVILVGEMRDRETVAAALTAAETGHLVISTLHSSSAPVAIDRIIDVFPEHQQRQVRFQLSIVLKAVLTQFLLPTRQPGSRVPAYEKMIVTSAIAHQIRDDKTYQIPSQIVTGRDVGMVPLERSLAELLRRRLISMEAAAEIAGDSDMLKQMIRNG